MRMLSNVQGLFVSTAALYALSNLQGAFAGHCEESEAICVKACHTYNGGQQAGACLIGCKLAYWACLYFSR